ncbi:MAG: acyl-CoA dehydrogenase [Candidatus Eiseniibacteriota bacterium]
MSEVTEQLLHDEHHAVRETARKFAVEVVQPGAAARDEKEEFPSALVRQMAELGFLGLPFPEEYGGAGLDTLAYCIAVEEIARVDASLAITLAAHVSLGCGPIYQFGTEAQKRKYLVPLAQGKHLGAFGLTEPNAGSDAGGTQTTAVREDGGFRVNGSKLYITNGSEAGTVVFTARTDKSQGTRGISSFIVEKGTTGFRAGKRENKMGLRSSDTVPLEFENVFIPGDQLLGELGRGFKQFLVTLAGGRISIGALSLGIAQGAYDAAVRYAMERKQFGKPIAEFQAIQFMLADMGVKIQAARHLVYDAAWRKDNDLPYNTEGAMAKLFASEASTWCADKAIQIHGGMGYMREMHVERYFRDAKLMEIGEGTSEIQRIVIARNLLKDAGYNWEGDRE